MSADKNYVVPQVGEQRFFDLLEMLWTGKKIRAEGWDRVKCTEPRLFPA